VLHVWFRQSGWIHHRSASDLRMARSLYLNSIRAQPVAPFTYVLLLTAYLPISWLDRLARCKHRLTGLLNYGRERSFAATESHCPPTVNLQTKRTKDSAA
jgi:hypothetical protein